MKIQHLAAIVVVPSCLALLPSTMLGQRSWGGTIDLGYVDATGNTATRTLTLGENFKWKTSPRFTILHQFRSIYGESSDTVIASLLDTDLNGDYRLFDKIGLTFGAGFDRNRFAGIHSRTEEYVGLSWSGQTQRGDSLRLIGGAVWTQQENTLNQSTDFIAAKVGMMLRTPVGKYAYFVENVEAIPNLDTSEDWRLNSESAIVASFSKRLALKLTYLIRYDNLPEPTFKDTDRLFTAGIQVNY